MSCNFVNQHADGGKNILDQWQLSGKGSNGKNKRQKKKKNKTPNTQESVPKKEVIKTTEKPSATSHVKNEAPIKVTEPLLQLGSQAKTTSENKKPPKKVDHRPSKESIQRTRTSSRASSGPHAGIDKSFKELQRHIAALEHSKMSLEEHLNKSQKRISEVFKELRQLMEERETALVSELEKRKDESYSYVTNFNFKCIELKMRTDRVFSMHEEQVDQLRDDIKNLSVEHKHLDDIAQTMWFSCHFNEILEAVQNFGEVHSAKPFTVTQLSKASSNRKNAKNTSIVRSTTAQGATSNHNASSIIRAQSDSLTKYEMGLKQKNENKINKTIFENTNLVPGSSDTSQHEVKDTENSHSESNELIETVEFTNSNFYNKTFQNKSNNRNGNNNNNNTNNATRNVINGKSNSSSSRTKKGKSNQKPKKNDQKNETANESKSNGEKVNGHHIMTNGTTPH